MTTTIDTILGRASAARLGSPAPTRAQLEIILSAGLNAPDHGRLRPWRYVVLQGDGLDLLGRAMSELKQRQTPEASAEVLDAVRMKARRAPVIVVAAAHLVKGHRKVPEIEQIIAVGAAVENMVLAAHSLGIGTMWKTGDPAYDSQVKQVLGLDPEDQIVAFLYLGTTLTSGSPQHADPSAHVRWLGAPAPGDVS